MGRKNSCAFAESEGCTKSRDGLPVADRRSTRQGLAASVQLIGGTMSSRRTKTKILVDGGNPEETLRVKNALGFLDGQTTNPTLVSKNPEIQRRLASGRKLTRTEQNEEYKRIVEQISPIVGDAGVSIEVFADFDTPPEQMVTEGEEMYSWISNAYIKYPCTKAGLQAAAVSVREGIRVNMTLCFSQEQAAAVYAATKGANEPVYVSPFIGRLDDRAETEWMLCAISRRCTRVEMGTSVSWQRA